MNDFKLKENGELEIIASSASSQTDFDFYIGKWNIRNRKRKEFLNNCDEWEEFDSTDDTTSNNTGAFDPPMVGSCEGNIGKQYAKDIYKGQEIIIQFHWDKSDIDNPIWSQAFSKDNGINWEWNWYMYASRVN